MDDYILQKIIKKLIRYALKLSVVVWGYYIFLFDLRAYFLLYYDNTLDFNKIPIFYVYDYAYWTS